MRLFGKKAQRKPYISQPKGYGQKGNRGEYKILNAFI